MDASLPYGIAMCQALDVETKLMKETFMKEVAICCAFELAYCRRKCSLVNKLRHTVTFSESGLLGCGKVHPANDLGLSHERTARSIAL